MKTPKTPKTTESSTKTLKENLNNKDNELPKGFLDNRKHKVNNGHGSFREVPTIKQKIFIEKMLETNGNQTESAAIAYDIKNRQVAANVGSEVMRKPYIRQEINELLEKSGLNLGETVKQHKWIINQNKDISTKLKAVQEHYDLVGLHPEEKGKSNVSVGLIINR